MKYKSTRGGVSGISFEEAVMMGLASDGGLLIPEKIPLFNEKDLKHLSELPYTKLAYEIISRFQEGIPSGDLMQIIQKTYSRFDNVNMIPVRKAAGMRIAELYHGPTYSFKDIALQFLGNLFEYILEKRKQKLNILGATSGDTGSAAIYGVKGKKNINIFMLYPSNRVSNIQELQMTTTESSNVFCLEVTGSFDNCQSLVKDVFSDLEFKEEYSLGAVNSINFARILAQMGGCWHDGQQKRAGAGGAPPHDLEDRQRPAGQCGRLGLQAVCPGRAVLPLHLREFCRLYQPGRVGGGQPGL